MNYDYYYWLQYKEKKFEILRNKFINNLFRRIYYTRVHTFYLYSDSIQNLKNLLKPILIFETTLVSFYFHPLYYCPSINKKESFKNIFSS